MEPSVCFLLRRESSLCGTADQKPANQQYHMQNMFRLHDPLSSWLCAIRVD